MQDVLCTGASPAGAQGRRPGSPGPGASQPPQTPGKRWRAFALLTAACGYEGFPQGLAPLRTGNMTTGGKAMTTRNDQMTSFTYTTYIRAPGPASTIPSAVALTPETAGPACASQVMNNPSWPAPACQVRSVRAHQRKNNAIEYA